MLLERMQRAAMLDTKVYAEVEGDQGANAQAAQVVLLGAFATGFGTLISSIMSGRGDAGVLGFLVGFGAAMLAWVVWSWITYFIGTRAFGGTATPDEMLRVLGFANAPQVLSILDFIPFFGGLVHLIVSIWLIATGLVAVRTALDFDTGRAIATMILGWFAMVLIRAISYGILHTMGLS